MAQHVVIFDSGVGGLSVWDEIRLHCPGLSCTYVMDNARFPYGELSEHALIDGACALIERAVAQVAPAAVVVACNSASTLVLPPLRQHLDIPVVGVVPAIKPAALLAPSGRIGLLATPGTVRRAYTEQLVREFARDCDVSRLGSSRLVALAEDKLAGHPVAVAEVSAILQEWHDVVPDVVVLGCTHFPLLRDEIQEALGDDVQLVDSGEAIARRLLSVLGETACGGEPGPSTLWGTEINERLVHQWPAFQIRGFSRYGTVGT